MKNRKPELLLPVGNTEAFFAAIEGGADAVYLGLKSFNARGRAANFTPPELAAIISYARSKHVKVFVTLNTLIKNREIPDLLHLLQLLSSIKPDALIVQDWGVFFLVKKYFSSLVLHASTQLVTHNSLGAGYALEKGFMRVILARELTLSEITAISKRTVMPLEVFVHGALCYSLSGMCLFSSYLGGYSANRGQCAQVCRREFECGSTKSNTFNLKDNQLVKYVGQLQSLGIAALKVEGRLKPPEYVYKTGKAYRRAIDVADEGAKAEEMLASDGARSKTEWFLGKDVRNAITSETQTGIYVGKISRILPDAIHIETDLPVKAGSRMRISSGTTGQSYYFTAKNDTSGNIVIHEKFQGLNTGEKVYLISDLSLKFNTILPKVKLPEIRSASTKINERSIYTNKVQHTAGKFELYCRITDTVALGNAEMSKMQGILFKLTTSKFVDFDFANRKLVEYKTRIYFEFPKFISEKSLELYRNFINRAMQNGFRGFCLSQLSQKNLLPANARFIAGESVYAMNDAAVRMIKDEGAEKFVYPLENDYPNLISGNSRDGIIAMYFHPDLFYSRMPVKGKRNAVLRLQSHSGNFVKPVENGFTVIRPAKPVVLFRFREKLMAKGFFRFLIDFSGMPVSDKDIAGITKAFYNAEKMAGATEFNFKMELR